MLTDDQAVRFRKIAYGLAYEAREAYPADVEWGDIVSEAMLKAHLLPEFNHARSSFASWVRRMMRWASYDYMVRRYRERVRTVYLDDPYGHEEREDLSPVDRQSFARWSRIRVYLDSEDRPGRTASSRPLAPRREEILRVRGQCRTEADAALILGLSERTVKGQLQRTYLHLGVNCLDDALAAIDA